MSRIDQRLPEQGEKEEERGEGGMTLTSKGVLLGWGKCSSVIGSDDSCTIL
jgi:hypothetical protein